MINSNFSWILEQQFHSKINIVVFLLLNSIKSTIFVFSEQNLQYVYWNSLKTTVVLISHYGNDHRKADTERHTQPFLRHEFCWRSIFVRHNTCRRLSDSKSFFFFLILQLLLMGNSGRLTWVRLQPSQKQCYPFLPVYAVLSYASQL